MHKRRFVPVQGSSGPVGGSLGACPTCGKQRYLSKSDAKREALRKQAKRHGPLNRAYKCGDYWHLTSQDRSRAVSWRDG